MLHEHCETTEDLPLGYSLPSGSSVVIHQLYPSPNFPVYILYGVCHYWRGLLVKLAFHGCWASDDIENVKLIKCRAYLLDSSCPVNFVLMPQAGVHPWSAGLHKLSGQNSGVRKLKSTFRLGFLNGGMQRGFSRAYALLCPARWRCVSSSIGYRNFVHTFIFTYS